MTEFGRLAGIALIISAVLWPLGSCVGQDEAGRRALKLACIEARGEWSWRNTCSFPTEVP